MAKYTLVAYLLWLVFGWAGIHHFYLRRPRQGLLWLTSFNGIFGIGWVRDFWRLPTYVREANDDKEIKAQFEVKRQYSESGPRIVNNWHRLLGQALFGAFYRGLIYCAIPWESSVINFATFLVPFGTAFGCYMVGNVGKHKCPFEVCLLGAYIGEFLMGEGHLFYDEPSAFLVGAVAAISTTRDWVWEKKKKEEHVMQPQSSFEGKKKKKKEKVSCGKCLLVVLLVYGVFVGLCCSFIYFNASVETEDGETIKVRDALDNFFNSPAWQQIKTAFWVLIVDIYQSWRTGGYEKAWNKFVDLADIEGEDHAYDVLGLERGTEFKEVRKRYKELAKEWHPDHHQGEEEKLEAQEKFMKYNNAYKVLEGIHKRKKKYGGGED